MPNRILREGIITSERVNALSLEAEILYRRLMSVVDDFGRIEAHPQIILARCYPLQLDKVSAQDVRNMLAECAQDVRSVSAECAQGNSPDSTEHSPQSLITVYSIKGKKYLQINDFGQRERTPKCPGPQDADIVRALSPQDAGGMHALARASNPPTPTNTNTNTAAEFKNGKPLDHTFSDWLERQYVRHPNKRDKILAEHTAVDHFSQGKFTLENFERIHIAWCESEDWRWKNGAKVKQTLAQWISDEGYRYMPNGHAKNESKLETPDQMRKREERENETEEAARAQRRVVKSARKETA